MDGDIHSSDFLSEVEDFQLKSFFFVLTSYYFIDIFVDIFLLGSSALVQIRLLGFILAF